MEFNQSYPNIILDKSFIFSVNVIKFAETLETKRKYVIANQLLKSATSIGANVREAQNAESKSDFIHKMKVAAKEADETEYWLLLCNATEENNQTNYLIGECRTIIKILSKIISSSKSRSSH